MGRAMKHRSIASVSVDEGRWVIMRFAAASAIAIPLTGWLMQGVGQNQLMLDKGKDLDRSFAGDRRGDGVRGNPLRVFRDLLGVDRKNPIVDLRLKRADS
ncbi:hypothetical protein CIC12_08270 [Burkholderia sp. SG-MS1]|uniref:hypothetical protein n=1 Tax=Paraburkholderia sp. SG-MS1 TaxID=2023741 RepID=UPI0016BBCD91|nr:hypothetical protein [Paraburkholderia sp. SG-MS1]NKJ46737.1 hypothetical protein [Paraburkholderia sp. SG-MS1]